MHTAFKYIIRNRYLPVLAILFLGSCSKNDVKLPNAPQYYPLAVGRYTVYNVDSVRYYNSTVKKQDTIRYQIKDSVQSFFTDLSGQKTYRIEEYRRFKPSDGWQPYKVYTRSLSGVYAEMTDGNERYLKLALPVAAHKSWNANAYNTLDSLHELTSSYISVNQPWAALGLKYDSTAQVQLQYDTTLISRFINQERYATNIGLVNLRHDSLFFSTNGTSGGDTSVAGFRINQVLSDYGPR